MFRLKDGAIVGADRGSIWGTKYLQFHSYIDYITKVGKMNPLDNPLG